MTVHSELLVKDESDVGYMTPGIAYLDEAIEKLGAFLDKKM